MCVCVCVCIYIFCVVCERVHEKHVDSILAKIYKRKKEGSKTNHRNPYLTYNKTNKHT